LLLSLLSLLSHPLAQPVLLALLHLSHPLAQPVLLVLLLP
jgi:hypothetical protein